MVSIIRFQQEFNVEELLSPRKQVVNFSKDYNFKFQASWGKNTLKSIFFNDLEKINQMKRCLHFS